MGDEKRKKKKKAGCPEYMITYGDMMTLLLCFFIFLFSFSTVDKKKFEKIVASFKAALGVLPGAKVHKPEDSQAVKGKKKKKDAKDLLKQIMDEAAKKSKREEKIKQQIKVIKAVLKEEIESKQVIVEQNDIGIVLRIPQANFFDMGSVNLKNSSLIILRKIAYILKFEIFKEYRIAVEGHTDAVPLKNSKKFASNWELSVLRSASVVRFFNDKANIPGERLQATGFSYYKPFVNKVPIKGIGVPENRRVEIVLFNVKDGKY